MAKSIPCYPVKTEKPHPFEPLYRIFERHWPVTGTSIRSASHLMQKTTFESNNHIGNLAAHLNIPCILYIYEVYAVLVGYSI